MELVPPDEAGVWLDDDAGAASLLPLLWSRRHFSFSSPTTESQCAHEGPVGQGLALSLLLALLPDVCANVTLESARSADAIATFIKLRLMAISLV
ncbi:MAG TPA: hypothetical protein VM140_04980 [Burkholderiales bacterium]|nr:hypothetical protein [Burkholderiales bacterium]